MGRMSNIGGEIRPVLTERARAYYNPEQIGKRILLEAEVSKERTQVPTFGKDEFKIYDTERGIRADSNRMKPEDITYEPITLKEHDLEFPIDKREKDEGFYDLEKRGQFVTTKAIARKVEKLTADLLQNTATYPTGNKATPSNKWSDYTNSDPVSDVNDAKESVRKKIGIKPNVLSIGASVLPILEEHPKITGKVNYSQLGVITMEHLKQIFKVDEVLVGEDVYLADGDTDFTDIWLDNCILSYRPEAAKNKAKQKEVPSFGYTFYKKGYPVVFTYTSLNGKVYFVNTTNIVLPKIVGATAGYLIYDVLA